MLTESLLTKFFPGFLLASILFIYFLVLVVHLCSLLIMYCYALMNGNELELVWKEIIVA